jgi:hypothetical protein
MKKALVPKVLVLLLLALAPANGERHKIWTQFGYEDFASGKTAGVAIDADGTLRTAAMLDSFSTVDAERIWDIAQGEDGTLYAATGDGGRLFAIDAKGKSRLIFDSPEVALHSLAIAKDGTLYAGSAPDGLIYKIDKDGSATTLTHTGSHYVWDLAFDKEGRLHAATGEPAKVLRITSDGETNELFAPTDRHLMTLLFSQGALYAGSASPGRIYQIGNDANRLLFEAPQEEIHALVGVENGPIYAAAISAKEDEKDTAKPVSAVYHLMADGSVHTLWSDNEVQLADIAPSADGLLLATDKENRILHLKADGRQGLLTQSADFKVSRLLRKADGTLYLGAAHAGQLNLLGSSGHQGHYESKVEDFVSHAHWGVIEWRGTAIKVQTRSGNSAEADDTWSTWSAPLDKSGSTITSPPARYIQYKAQLTNDDAQLEYITLYGLRANLPPAISSLQIQPYRTPQARNGNTNAPSATQNRSKENAPQARSLKLIRWQASDPNEDELVYDLYLRGEGQQAWKMAHDNESQASLLWNTATMPEGWTQLKLVASDRADNPPGQALHSERISAPFAIDNSPPRVELKTHVQGDGIVVEAALSDHISALKKVQYSVDYGDDEFLVAALDGIYDSRTEKAHFTLTGLAPGEHIIAVQAWDILGNVGAQQIIIQIK